MPNCIAHKLKEHPEITQTLKEHLTNTSLISAEFAKFFGSEQCAEIIGLTHDIGKYSEKFQARINGAQILVDHSTAGAQLLYKQNNNKLGLIAAYCIMGHHAGLPDGGDHYNPSGYPGTLYCRLNEEIEDYSAYKNEINIDALKPPRINIIDGFGAAFFTRMLYSCLVDADFLDTESFMNQQLRPQMQSNMQELLTSLNKHISKFSQPKTELDYKRTQLLESCIAKAKEKPGIYTLTAPTGSGKTIASMAFALNHAVKNKHKRIIYVVPYNTIIEQNAKVYEDIFGEDVVLQHHSGVDYENSENEQDYVKQFATENWDAPIIITSSVQFFESLFANRSSKCRKLHNIANSIIIFDEAQMIPPKYLIPCTAAIKELIANYRCTAVLATATQSSLDEYFQPLEISEIAKNPEELYEDFKRVNYEIFEEEFTLESLQKELSKHSQALCIVNTRKTAQKLAKMLNATHLSTTMYPEHRKQVLADVRQKLKDNKECIVISTSMIEAGVDVDFPVVFRQVSGLDSIVQAGGRCNREGKLENAIVYVFRLESSASKIVEPNISAFGHVQRKYKDISSIRAIKEYFNQLFYQNKGNLGEDIVQEFNAGEKSCSFPFKTISTKFNLIDNETVTVYILHDNDELEEKLKYGERSRKLFRQLQKYAVSLYKTDVDAIKTFEAIDEEILIFRGNYDENLGIDLCPEEGQAIIV